jgi:K+-transporting ATPase KdpF subunit
MKLISIPLILAAPSTAAATQSSPGGYVIGAVISLFILVYLIYSLIKPEKF